MDFINLLQIEDDRSKIIKMPKLNGEESSNQVSSSKGKKKNTNNESSANSGNGAVVC